MNDPGDERLLADALRGDERAFAAFYDRHVEPLYLLALRELGDEDEAQEVTQEVFAIAWRKARRIRLVGGSAASWLEATCRNVAANRMRSVRRRPVMTPVEELGHTLAETDRVDEEFDSRLLMGRLETEVLSMPELDQQVYRSILRDGLSYDETAEALGISTASVRKRLNRVRTRLRKRAEGER
ncbi:RNA polymerase sigma factor [Herbiconiux ginsengi]|uniref:RNA polymerase sigma-70 factor, ECF subfamily n=1 Tax=Herbiconiux ginsengi TaxID=381665 RepID=A0A1H3T4T7_9MICO|nr:sigma-70 family RNA polymerase sigma factor [Herbiconiux ginsengi]SDZ45060.1 RNA polymerase sigma-70 factor, ECF subfamily [Herbiconiux ginsengi]